MKPEIRAKKDKCTLVASVDHGKLRVLGASDDPVVVLEGRVLELRASGTQVHVIQRDAVRDTSAPPDPYEDSQTDFRGIPAVSAGGRKDQHACNSEGGVPRL
jgi:hypothetical protein